MNPFQISIIIFLFSSLMCGCGGGGGDNDASSAVWETVVVDTDGNVGEYCSIALDDNGYAHIAYFSHIGDETLGDTTIPYGNLKYATNTGGQWETQTLDTWAGMTPRIIVDENNAVHIVHSALGASDPLSLTDLKYTTNATGNWETVAISSQVVKGSDASIAVDADNRVHISAYNNEGAGTSEEGPEGGLRYITNATGEWTWVDVDSGLSVGNDTDITVDALNRVHISYLDKNAGLKYATNATGAWVVDVIDGTANVGWNTSIAADSGDGIHISYSDPSPTLDPPGNGYLKYAASQSGVWTVEIVDDVDAGFFTGLAADSKDAIHIAYYTYNLGVTGRLMYATNASGTWEKQTADAAEFVGLYCAIAVEPDGTPHISHYDYVNQALKYSKRAQ